MSWAVEFSDELTGVNGPDFALVTGGLGGPPGITSVTPIDGNSYTVTASTGTGSGTLGLNLNDNDSIQDAGGNRLGGTGTGTAGSGGAGNGSFTGEAYDIDRTPPTVVSVVRANANPTNGRELDRDVQARR